MTNKKRYASKTVHGGKREAQRSLNEMLAAAENGLSVWTSATVGELLERWLEFADCDFSPSTVKETRGFIDRNLLLLDAVRRDRSETLRDHRPSMARRRSRQPNRRSRGRQQS